MNTEIFEETACPFCGQVRLGGGDKDSAEVKE